MSLQGRQHGHQRSWTRPNEMLKIEADETQCLTRVLSVGGIHCAAGHVPLQGGEVVQKLQKPVAALQHPALCRKIAFG